MPDSVANRVKQHYVPQFYFRNFARDERLCAYNLANEEGYPPTHIRNICYEKYFYGDAEHEEQIGQLEGEMASVVHQIVQKVSLEPVENDPQSLFFLDAFISFTHARTKAARQESSALSQEMLEMMVEVGVEYGELDDEHLELVRNDEVRLEGPDHELRQLLSLYGPVYFSDLSRVLIWNDTERDFITSDHPGVLDNSRFKSEVAVSTTGYSCAGLQVFCPLSNKLQMLLFDPYAYRLDANSEYTVIVNDETVVGELNKLQLLNCLENCHYRDEADEGWVDGLYQEVKDSRPEEFVEREHDEFYDPEEERTREIVCTSHPTIEFSPELPFVDELPTARFTPVRSPELRDTAEALYEDALEDAAFGGDETEGLE